MKKLTKEVKDNWIKALEGNKYTQGSGQLKKKEYFHRKVKNIKGELIKVLDKTRIVHCPIGVLGEIHKDLSTDIKYMDSVEKARLNITEDKCPYNYLSTLFGMELVKELYLLNDRNCSKTLEDRNYNKSIDFININF